MENNTIKPNVMPNRAIVPTLTPEERKAAFEMEKAIATNEIYESPASLPDTPDGYKRALEAMQNRTLNQVNKSKIGQVVEEDLSENSTITTIKANNSKNEELIRLRDEALAKNKEQTNKYQEYAEEATNRKYNNEITMNTTNNIGNIPPSTPTNNTMNGGDYGKVPNNINPYILEISQPNYNSPFDVIPLPSKGKTYRDRKPNIRLSYMTTADENILTSPNLLQSGEFLSILINRKILEPSLRYKDLLVGDRNAIMLWLRATGYGEMYPVTLMDENGVAFETEINLNELKTKELGAEPDDEGLFYYKFNLSQAEIKFKFLTCGDVDELELILENEKENNVPVNNASTYRLERMIVEVNGSRDRNIIKDFVNSIRIKDAKDFNQYVDSIESGVDLNIKVRTPGGGSIDTFLPLNLGFFWPDFGL